MPGGVTGALGAEGGLVPEALSAVTVNVYEVSFTNPLIKTEVGGKVMQSWSGAEQRKLGQLPGRQRMLLQCSW